MHIRFRITAAIIFGLSPLYGTVAAQGRVCLPIEAVATVAQDDFASASAFSVAMNEPLKQMAAIANKATKQGPIKDQISIADQQAFNEARAQILRIKLSLAASSRENRNMHILDQLADFDEIVDLDGFDMNSVKEGDPRLFYFNIISALREFQPSPKETILPEYKGICTMEAALSSTEHFNMQQMAGRPTDAAVLNLILDMQRIEQLLAIMHKAKELDIKDASELILDANGEPKPLNDTFDKWLATQSLSSQKIGTVILKYVDTMWPSNNHYELDHQVAQTAQINAEYPR